MTTQTLVQCGTQLYPLTTIRTTQHQTHSAHMTPTHQLIGYTSPATGVTNNTRTLTPDKTPSWGSMPCRNMLVALQVRHSRT